MKVVVLGRFDILIRVYLMSFYGLDVASFIACGDVGVDGFQEVLLGFHEAFYSFSTVDGRHPAPPRMYKTL